MQFETLEVPLCLLTGCDPLDLFRVADIVDDAFDESPPLSVEYLTVRVGVVSSPERVERLSCGRFRCVLG